VGRSIGLGDSGERVRFDEDRIIRKEGEAVSTSIFVVGKMTRRGEEVEAAGSAALQAVVGRKNSN
jgi:hypothetical protein